MTEGLTEPRAEQVLVEPAVDPVVDPVVAPARSSVSWPRFAYSFEFLIAMICVFTVWSQVGGQGHLDLLPWYVKLVCALAMSWATVRLTAGMVEEEKAWNRRTIRWLFGLAAVATVMAGITYYYHLHEVSDEPDTDETSATSVSSGDHAKVPSRI